MKTLDFDALSLNDRNLVLTTENDYNTYQNLNWLANCVAAEIFEEIKDGQYN